MNDNIVKYVTYVTRSDANNFRRNLGGNKNCCQLNRGDLLNKFNL